MKRVVLSFLFLSFLFTTFIKASDPVIMKIAGKDIRTELGRKKLRETRDLLLGDR